MSCSRLLLAALYLIALLPAPSTAEQVAERPRVRLAVLIVFDQLRGDYLERWDKLYGKDGFHRMEREGIWFRNCHYPYAGTWTGAGHASLATGASPRVHGVIANSWYDRKTEEDVDCAADVRYRPVPGRVEKKPSANGAPVHLKAPTLADALKRATNGKAKVVSLSLKDRGAVLPGGQAPDACYWFDGGTGTFMTSTYYRDALHPWVAAFNRDKPADAWFGKPWTHLLPDLDYEKFSGPDDVASEDVGIGQGRTFPHPMDGGLDKPGSKYYSAVFNSPHGNELLLQFAERAIDAEKLGRHDVPDLLCISFSSNDAIGHTWGPDSQEVMDVTLNTDRVVAELLSYLDAKVGKGKYIVALSADHGVCPLPEVAAREGKDAKRVRPGDLKNAAQDFLTRTFPKEAGKPIARFQSDCLYLNPSWVKAQAVEQAKIETALVAFLKTLPDMQTAYSRTQLLKGVARDDAIGQKVQHSFYPERSGDVMMVQKPYHLVYPVLRGTSHGTPHPYDTHVPLLIFGPGLVPGTRTDRVTPQANVAILAHALGIKPPKSAEAVVPPGVFAAPKGSRE